LLKEIKVDQDLKKEVSKIKRLAQKNGKGVSAKETLVDHIVIIACDSRAALIMKGEHEVYGEMIAHFKVDLKKWVWAEAEGFAEGDHFSEIIHDIIIPLNYPNLLDYLIYDR
jgi:hypothetical protein